MGVANKSTRTKTRRRVRVKALKDGPYTQKEAEAAVGFYTDNGLYHRQAQNVNSLEVNMQSPDVVT
ncbi:MAG: hypothetical protein M1818_003143 [Claussenomyces sp. TS43310]|nr:MAG: hypothetical protein M1818_003143 [Claussenomyces sp. TS43310]